MKICKSILIILALSNSINLFGSCDGPFYSITELLNHDPKHHHIFTCEILETYVRGHSFESIAVVKRRFRGSPNDTIYINTGGGTTAGGKKLFPKSKWLIFSTTRESFHYGATVCDFLSSKIESGNNNICERDLSPRGKMFLEVLEEYEIIKKEQYSGRKEIKVNGELFAKGSFKSGLPDGNWVHFKSGYDLEEEIIKSEISYKNGMLDGEYLLYDIYFQQNKIIGKTIYKSDLPILAERSGKSQKKYEYRSDRERIYISTRFDTLGNILKQ